MLMFRSSFGILLIRVKDNVLAIQQHADQPVEEMKANDGSDSHPSGEKYRKWQSDEKSELENEQEEVNDETENVHPRRIQLIKLARPKWMDREEDPRQCPTVGEEVVDIFGEEAKREVGIGVVNDGLAADLAAVEFGDGTHEGSRRCAVRLVWRFHGGDAWTRAVGRCI
jgi:hypothetical protein